MQMLLMTSIHYFFNGNCGKQVWNIQGTVSLFELLYLASSLDMPTTCTLYGLECPPYMYILQPVVTFYSIISQLGNHILLSWVH